MASKAISIPENMTIEEASDFWDTHSVADYPNWEINMNKQALKDKLIEEIETLPQDKIGELYDIVHYFGLGLKMGKKDVQDKKKKALEFFGIWKDMAGDKRRVLEEIQSRRERTLRGRNL